MMLTSDIALLKGPNFAEFRRNLRQILQSLKSSSSMHGGINSLLQTWGLSHVVLVTASLLRRHSRHPSQQVRTSYLISSPSVKQIKISLRSKKESRGAFIDLAFKCASTFPETDYQGGCNGAYVHFDYVGTASAGTIETLL